MNDAGRPDEVKQAEREVERRKRELARRLERAGEQGERMARGLGEQLKPALMGVAVVAGAGLVLGVTLLAMRRRQRRGWSLPERPSRGSALLRSVGLVLLRLAVRQAGNALAQRLSRPALPARPIETVQ